MPRIDAIRFGFAGGVVSAFILFVLTLLASVNGFGLELLNILKGLFPGFDITVFGSVVASIYGFIIGFLELFFIAFIYNLFGPSKEP